MRASQFGVVVTIPLWDRRSGPVGEAAAQLSRARNELEARSSRSARHWKSPTSNTRLPRRR